MDNLALRFDPGLNDYLLDGINGTGDIIDWDSYYSNLFPGYRCTYGNIGRSFSTGYDSLVRIIHEGGYLLHSTTHNRWW
jgi:hypothetical protein